MSIIKKQSLREQKEKTNATQVSHKGCVFSFVLFPQSQVPYDEKATPARLPPSDNFNLL